MAARVCIWWTIYESNISTGQAQLGFPYLQHDSEEMQGQKTLLLVIYLP